MTPDDAYRRMLAYWNVQMDLEDAASRPQSEARRRLQRAAWDYVDACAREGGEPAWDGWLAVVLREDYPCPGGF